MAKNSKRKARTRQAPEKHLFYADAADAADAVSDDAPEQAPAKGGEKDDDIVRRFREEYEAGYNKDRDNQDQAYKDLKFIADVDGTGGQWDPKALQERSDEERPVLVVNQCPQFVRQVTGDLRQLKPAIKVVPLDDAASKDIAAKVLPGMIRYIEQRSAAASIYFAAADQQVGAGIGHWRVTHEYAGTRTFNQEIRIAPIPDGIAVVWDPDAVMLDRSDAMYCFVPVDMARKKFEKKYPGKSFDPLSPSSSECWTSWFSDDHVRVAEWFYKDPEKKRLALYPDGKIDDVTGDPEAEALAKAAGVEIEERDGFCCYRALVSANDVIEEPVKWPGPDIPIVPLIAEEVQIGRQVVRRGVVRVLRDVQRIYNYAVSTQTEVIALQPKAPFIGTREQFEKYADQWETANTRNWPYLEYTHVAGVPPPQRAQPPVASSGLDDLMVKMQEAMNSTTGIYPSALGAKSNEVSGRAIMARQREGDTGTFVYVSNFAGALRRTGQIIVDMIPQIYDTKRTIQIAGEDGKIDQLPINQPGMNQEGSGPGIALNDVTVGAYQVAVEMGPSFSTKRQEAADGMNELLRTLGPQGAMMFIDLLVKQMDWPLADKIAERAKFMLPPAIAQKEAAEAGEPPPPPPPPSPEQQQAMALEQQKAQEQQQANIELARKNELDDRRQQLEMRKIEIEAVTQEHQNELEARKIELELHRIDMELIKLNHGQTAEGQENEASFLEQQQKNIELARKNELDAQRQQLEMRKIEMEAQTMRATQVQEQQKLVAQAHQNKLDEAKIELELHKIDMELVKLSHGQTVEGQEGEAANEATFLETQLGNIELARKNELEARRQALEMRKIELEHAKLGHGEGAESDEQRLANIESARKNEIDARRQELEFRKIDLEGRQLGRDEVQGQRSHELAMNPPPEPEAAPAAAPKGGESDLEARVNTLTEVVMQLSDVLQALVGGNITLPGPQGGPPAAGGQPPGPAEPTGQSTPAPAPPDYIPQLLDIIKTHAGRPKPLGTKRTPEGMQVIYDEGPPPAPPEEMPPV